MSKTTAAVILTSPARLAPWGDDAWRFTGAIQVVSDGPDWLYAKWTVPGESGTEPSSGRESRFVSMVLRDAPRDQAADIAVMALALLQPANWDSLASWWDSPEERGSLDPLLQELARENAGEFKLAVVETEPGGVPDAVVARLRELGFEVVKFGAVR